MIELQIIYKLYILLRNGILTQKESTALNHVLKIGTKKVLETNLTYKQLIETIDEMEDWSSLANHSTFQRLLQVINTGNPEFQSTETLLTKLDEQFKKKPILEKLVKLILELYFTTLEGAQLLILAQLMPLWQKEVSNFDQIAKFADKIYSTKISSNLSKPTLELLYNQSKSENKPSDETTGWGWNDSNRPLISVDVSKNPIQSKAKTENLILTAGSDWQFEKFFNIKKFDFNFEEVDNIFIAEKVDSKLLLRYTKSSRIKDNFVFLNFEFTDEKYEKGINYYYVNQVIPIRQYGKFNTNNILNNIEDIMFNSNQKKAVWDDYFGHRYAQSQATQDKPYNLNYTNLLNFLARHKLVDYKYIEKVLDVRRDSYGSVSAVLFTEYSLDMLHNNYFSFRRRANNDNLSSLQYIRDKIKPHLDYTPSFESQVLDTYDQAIFNQKTFTGDKTRGILSDILSIDWSNELKTSEIKNAKKILDEEFYGQENLKQMILEYVSLNNHTTKTYNKHLLLVGNAGVGKTMIARALARIIGRRSYLISLSSKSNLSLITGVDISLIGSTMGELTKSIQVTKSINPMIILDEVDKATNSSIINSLYQILDRNQSKEFYDLYLRLSLNLEKFMFVLTANSLEKIPDPILNRCHIIELKDYERSEIIEIVLQHSFPKLLTNLNLKELSISITKEFVESMLDFYKSSGGIRFYENKLTNIISALIYEYEHNSTIVSKNLALDRSKTYLIK